MIDHYVCHVLRFEIKYFLKEYETCFLVHSLFCHAFLQ